jgi:hypothetical protein
MRALPALLLLAVLVLSGCAQPAPSDPSIPRTVGVVGATAPVSLPRVSTASPSLSPTPTPAPASSVKSMDDAFARLAGNPSVQDEMASSCDKPFSESLALSVHAYYAAGAWRASCTDGPTRAEFFDPEKGWKPLAPGMPVVLERCSEDDASFLARAFTLPAGLAVLGLGAPLPNNVTDFYAFIGICSLSGTTGNWARYSYAVDSTTGKVHS